MLTVPILIPVLTNFPLPLSDMGDILGGGLILTLGSFLITLAGLDSGSAYGGIGSSRAVMLGILAEPTLILVFVGITLLAKSMLPFVVNHLLVATAGRVLEPRAYLPGRRLLHPAAGRDRPSADPFEHAHRGLHDRGGAHPRVFRAAARPAQVGLDDEAVHPLHDILQCAAAALGALHQGLALGALGAAAALLRKFFLVALAVVVVETAQSRLRYYRYQEPLAASFLLAILAIVANQLR